MRKGILILLVVLSLGSASGRGQTDRAIPGQIVRAGFVERDAFVPDETTAIDIARAVLRPIFGEKRIDQIQKFYATLHDDVWVVEDAPPNRLQWIAPVLNVQIDKKRGCILKIREY